MSGVSARMGFRFQDMLLVARVVDNIVERRVAQICGTLPPPDAYFGIEIADNQSGPDWDLLTIEYFAGKRIHILEEVKSKLVKKEDRIVLWRRARATAQTSTEQFTFRLTVDEEKHTQHEPWNGISGVVGAIEPGAGKRNATTPQDYAAEALYEMTRDDLETAPVQLERARRILEQFEYHVVSYGKLEKSVVDQLELLSCIRTPQWLLDTLCGHIARRAASLDSTLHKLSVKEILEDVEEISALAVAPREYVLTRSILVDSHRSAGGRPTEDMFESMPRKTWREVQPAAFTALNSPATCIALTGRGGLGKSVMLDELAAQNERTTQFKSIWIDGAALSGISPQILEGALNVEAFVAGAQGKVTTVFIDAFEAIEHSLSSLTATLRRCADGKHLRVIVTCRHTTWNQLRHTQEKLAGWTTIELNDWPEEVVIETVRETLRPKIGEDLKKLLQTPLLLELFLRTFGLSEEMVPSLQSRHAILSTYWCRRILPRDDKRAASRLKSILALAEAETKGISRHDIEIPDDLLSEGLLVMRGGLSRFRHSLLRDFAILIWSARLIQRTDQVPTSLIQHLSSINRELVQFGTIRAAIEAALDPDDGNDLSFDWKLDKLLREFQNYDKLLRSASEILGELDNADDIDLLSQTATLSKDVNIDITRSLGRRVLASAQLVGNASWIGPLSRLPLDASYLENAAWIGKRFLIELAEYLDIVGATDISSYKEKLRTLASKMREWSVSSMFASALNEHYGWGWALLISVVAPNDPSPQTLAWLKKIPLAWRIQNAILDCLPVIANLNRDLQESDLLDTYLRAAALVDDKQGGLVPAPDIIENSLADYHRFEQCLLGKHRPKNMQSPGLLESRPAAFYSVAFNVIVGFERIRKKQWKKELLQLRSVEEHWDSILKSDKPAAEVEALELELQKKCIPNETIVDGLYNDLRATEYWEGDRVRSAIIEHLRQLPLTVDEKVLQLFSTAAFKSCSAVARVVIIEKLAEAEGNKQLEVLRTALSDARLYHCREASYWISRAIQLKWDELGKATQKKIINAIESVMQSPWMRGVYGVGPLLQAIPADDRPKRLMPFIHLYDMQGWSPAPSPPQTVRRAMVGCPDYDNLYDEYFKLGLDVDDEERWRRIYLWQADELQKRPFDAIPDFKGVLCCLPSNDIVVEKPWPLQKLQSLLQYLADYQNKISDKAIQEDLECDELVKICKWAINIAGSIDSDTVNHDKSTLEVAESHGLERSAWNDAIGLIDHALVHPNLIDLPEANEITESLWKEVRRISDGLSESTARRILSEIRPYHWFKTSQSKVLLTELLTEKVSGGGALSWGLENIQYFSSEEQKEILEKWLAIDGTLPFNKASTDFADRVGRYLGGGVLIRRMSGEHVWARLLVDEWLVNRPKTGLLSNDEVYREWLLGVVFGAKFSIDQVSSECSNDYASLMTTCFEKLIKLPDATDLRNKSNFALHIFHSLVEKIMRGKIEITWWHSMQNLAVKMIKEGNVTDIFSLVFQLREQPVVSKLGGAVLLPVAHALGNRIAELAQTSPTTLINADFSQMENWPDTLRYGAEFIEAVACANNATAAERQDLYKIVNRWSEPDIDCKRAHRAAKLIRQLGE